MPKMPIDGEMTIQDAADLLGVSRPALVKLLDAGAIPFRTLAAPRRLKAAARLRGRAMRFAAYVAA